MTANRQSQVVYDYLLSYIEDNDLEIGSKLPTEKELCEQMNVSRSTVREAVSMLQARNVVDVIKGSGTYVKSRNADPQENKLTIDNLRDFMEIRISVEILAIRLFIANYSDENYALLENAQKRFEKAVKEKNAEKMADCDEAFHGTLFKCTGNSLLIDIGELLANSFRYYRHRTFEIEVHRMDAVNAHRKILEAIRMKDTDEAIFSMRQHLDTSYENALGTK